MTTSDLKTMTIRLQLIVKIVLMFSDSEIESGPKGLHYAQLIEAQVMAESELGRLQYPFLDFLQSMLTQSPDYMIILTLISKIRSK